MTMKIDLTQKRISFNYHFDVSIDGSPVCRAKANRTVWPFLRKITVSDPTDSEILSIAREIFFCA